MKREVSIRPFKGLGEINSIQLRETGMALNTHEL